MAGVNNDLAYALGRDIADLDPQRIRQWVEGKGWIAHPTAQPKTLLAWRPGAEISGPNDPVVSMSAEQDDRWYLLSAATLIGQVADHHEMGLIQALRELELL
jgi:hypothetical protein